MLVQRAAGCDDSSVSRSESRERNGRAAELEQPKVSKMLKDGGSNDHHKNVLQSSFGTQLLRCSQLLDAPATVTTNNSSERNFCSCEGFYSRYLSKLFDAGSAELSARRDAYSHQYSPVLILVCF